MGVKNSRAAGVYRRGRTARSFNHETNKVELGADKECLRLKFSLSSKGGGITDVSVRIGAEVSDTGCRDDERRQDSQPQRNGGYALE